MNEIKTMGKNERKILTQAKKKKKKINNQINKPRS